jgi:hypothetical protein
MQRKRRGKNLYKRKVSERIRITCHERGKNINFVVGCYKGWGAGTDNLGEKILFPFGG